MQVKNCIMQKMCRFKARLFRMNLAVDGIQRPHLSVRPLNGREKKENERNLAEERQAWRPAVLS